MNCPRKIRTNVNLARSVFSYYRRKERASSFPLTFWIEVTNKCNLACHYCSAVVNPKRHRGNMSMETYTRIIDQIAPLCPGYITLHLAGDPLLNPHLCAMISLANENGIGTCFSTNGMLLNAAIRDRLIDSGLGSIRIDFSTDREGFEIDASRVLLVHLSFPGRSSTSAADLREMFKEFPFLGVKEMQFRSWAGEYAGRVSEREAAIPSYEKCRQPYSPCRHPWMAMTFTWDGKVVPCCRDLQGEMVVGDINEKHVLEIWNDGPLRQLRRKLRREEYSDVFLCRHCSALWEQMPLHRMVMAGLWRRLVSKPFSAIRHHIRFGS